MTKRIASLFLALFLFTSLLPVAYAHPSQAEHDKDLCAVLFGEDYTLTGENKAKFQAIADAAALCIDQFSVNETIKSKKALFDSLDQRIGFSFSFDDIELQKVAGGKSVTAKTHRRYTHRGWDYSEYPLMELWNQRKKILTATVNKEIFNKSPGVLKQFKWLESLVYSEEACNKQCEAFCELVYYVHILGDYEEATSLTDEFRQLIPLVRHEDPTAPALIDELISLIPILFDSQSWSTSVLIQELEGIKADAERIVNVQGGLNTQEQFDAYHQCAMDITEALRDYIPSLLKNADFFNEAFY